ncbi:MAG: M28 family peptidase [Ardenticatenaceae bacterium]|nr:M28 family peptidase [Ardenticatenaceae bacterium]
MATESEYSSLFELVKALTELPGPIGHEQPVNDFLQDRWLSRTERVWQTPVGNLFAFVGGKGPRLLIGGHADEICLMVKSITDDGFLHLSIWNADREGRPPKWLFPIGQRALVVGPARPVYGIFATGTGHAASQAQREKPRPDWNDIFVDLGLRSRAEVAARGVRVGHRVIWNPATQRLGDAFIVGKAMDNRAALAIMTALLDALDPAALAYELYFASTVLEETGLEGAHSVAREGEFDQAIALDVGLAGDIPTVDLLDVPVRLGDGPVVVHQDSEIHYSRAISNRLIALAEREAVPIQHAVFQRYASDGAAFIRQGVPTALLAFPTRYTHSPFETVHENDLALTVRLLKAYVQTDPSTLPH